MEGSCLQHHPTPALFASNEAKFLAASSATVLAWSIFGSGKQMDWRKMVGPHQSKFRPHGYRSRSMVTVRRHHQRINGKTFSRGRNIQKKDGPSIDPSHVQLLCVHITSSTARGGGGSFKKRKTIGEIGCCESRMSKQKH